MIRVTLGAEHESFVQQRVAAGQLASADDLVEEAIRLMQERERSIASVREKIQAGMDSLEAGRWVDGETFMDELLRDLAEPSPASMRLNDRVLDGE
jgi:antitoxin ParD1/3/4